MRLAELKIRNKDRSVGYICIPISSIVELYSDTLDSSFCILVYRLPNKRRKINHLVVAEPYKSVAARLEVVGNE